MLCDQWHFSRGFNLGLMCLRADWLADWLAGWLVRGSSSSTSKEEVVLYSESIAFCLHKHPLTKKPRPTLIPNLDAHCLETLPSVNVTLSKPTVWSPDRRSQWSMWANSPGSRTTAQQGPNYWLMDRLQCAEQMNKTIQLFRSQHQCDQFLDSVGSVLSCINKTWGSVKNLHPWP